MCYYIPILASVNFERRSIVIKSIIQQSIDYIDNNIYAEISIDDLCNKAGYSHEHYCRLFKQYVGMPPAKFIIRRKLIYAVYEMAQGKAKTNTAFRFGFDTYAGFYKAFKREYKCSPSNYIKEHKGYKPCRINILQEEHIMISKDKIKSILANWDISNLEITNIINKNTGKQSDNAYYVGDDYVVKFTANFGYVNSNIRIIQSLANAGIATTEIIKTVNGDNYIQDGELYFILNKRIKGQQLLCDDIFRNLDIATEIGRNIAKLHIALSEFDVSDYDTKNIYDDVVSIIPNIQDKCRLTKEFVENYKKTFGVIFNKLPKQIIHRDINPSNMLFDNGVFMGFVDFDLSEVNIRIFDICYCSTAILSECFSNEIDSGKWKDILNNTIKGYESITPLSIDEKLAIPYVIYSIQIICINYFSKFDKYKDLTDTNMKILDWLIKNL